MKRIFGILVSAAVLISMAFFVSCEANSEPTNENTSQETDSTGSNSGSNDETETKGRIILHAQYQYIYVWESGSQFDNKQNEMEAEGNGWYRFEIESSSAMVIFKPNADDWNGKTDDLSATTGEWWYDNGSLHSSKPNSGGSSDGNGGSEGQTAKIILHAQYPYIYIWESRSQFDTKQSEMDTEDNGWYRFEIESSSAMVIFKPNADDWNGKTDDLSATTGEWWYDNGSLHSSKPDSDNSSGGNGGSGGFTIPSAPQNVTTKATSSSSIEVSWDAVDEADDYVVYYRPSLGIDNESYERNGNESTKTTSGTSISIQGLEYKTYLFWVTAKNSAGESRESDVEIDYPSSSSSSGGSSSGTTTLSAPTGLIATTQSSSEIILSWNAVSDATEYQIYCSEDSFSSSSSLLGNTASAFITVTGLKTNTTYYFWVKAINSTIISDYSSYAYATTKAASSSSSGSGGSSTTTNDLLSDMTTSNTFTAPTINMKKTVLTDGKNGFYIPLSNSSQMNAEYYILYRSTTSKTDKSEYKKIKTISRSSNIAFEDFDIDFTKNKTYYYVVVATSSKNDTYGTISTNGLSVVLGNTRIRYTITTDNSKQSVYRYVKVDGGDIDYLPYAAGDPKTKIIPLEPGNHSIEWCRTKNGSYMQVVSNYNFLPGCEYSINLDSGKISSSSPTLSSNSISTIAVP